MLTQNTVDHSDRCQLIKDKKRNFYNQSLGMFIIKQTRHQNTATEVTSLKLVELKNLTSCFLLLLRFCCIPLSSIMIDRLRRN